MNKKNFTIAILLCLTFLLTSCTLYRESDMKKIEKYIRINTEFSFSDILDFEWDEAYNELNYYGRGEDIKELTGYDFEVNPVGVDHMRRLLFFNNGKLVREIKYEFYVFEFPDTVIVFYPSTRFVAEWYTVINNNNEYEHVNILLKE